MKVLVKFFVFDLPPGFADAELELPEGSVVKDVLDACLDLLEQRNVTMDVNELKTATVMVNNKWSDADDPVADGDTVSIIRPMDGG
ncbi:MAG: MoaD/ThiS family protein [Peptococcaceae bacterium]|jgi:molybdopterin converting factor small subunit|nr:MoaD/ThiS family protein [Peptococcaceae bacterium]